MKSEDIEIAHRVGKRNRKGARAIIVRFVSQKVKNEVFWNHKKLMEKKCGIFIVEDLTKKNYQLLVKVKDNPHVDKVWTASCKVFVKTKNSKIVQISSLQDLDALPLPGDVTAGGDATSKPACTRDEVTQPHRRGQSHQGQGSVRGGPQTLPWWPADPTVALALPTACPLPPPLPWWSEWNLRKLWGWNRCCWSRNKWWLNSWKWK